MSGRITHPVEAREGENGWATAYRAFGVISPWAVGRYSALAGADTFNNHQCVPDLAECSARGLGFMPVVYPKFSWHNLKDDPSPLNQILSNGGMFYWRQVYNLPSRPVAR